MKTPLNISVLLSVRDGAATLGRALESLLAQTERDFEIVAVDDGSKDATARALANFRERDPRVRVLESGGAGLVPSLNLGLSACRGRYIARMDADDVCHPSRLELQRRYLDENPSVEVVASRVVFGGDARSAAGFAAYVDWSNSILDGDAIELRRFVESPIVNPSACFRRETAIAHGTWREGEFPEDYELWLRWLERGVRMAKLPQALLTWSDPPTRLSRRDPRYSPGAFWECKAGYLARFLAPRLDGRPLAFWGAGRRTRQAARPLLSRGLRPSAWIDIDPRKIGSGLEGVPVVAEGELERLGRPYVVSLVGNRGAGEEISRRLGNLGYREGADFVLAG